MSRNSEVKVGLCTDEDIRAAFTAMSDGFGHDAPYFDGYFPQHDTPAGRDQAVKRLTKLKKTADNAFFVKAVIPASNGRGEQIVGLALWTHLKEPPPRELEKVEDVDDVWPDKDDQEFMKRIWRDFVVPRGQAVRESNGAGVYMLELLGVNREYQRRGAGAALVKWGTDAAEEKGLEAIVEGTPQGIKCYHQGGFQTEIEQMKFDVGEEFRDRKQPVLSFLRKKVSK